MALSFQEARARMVEAQLVARGIGDERVLAAMAEVPRHEFVPPAERDLAYEDGPLGIGGEQTISQPYMVARMTELLELRPGERVLEIGTGSGYQAAVLAELTDAVFTVERLPALSANAQHTLKRLGYGDRVHLKVGDGCEGWPEHAPYDGVIVTAAAREIPRPIVQQLADNGRLVLPLGDVQLQGLARIRRRRGRLESEYFGECRFVKLIGAYGWDT